MSATILVVDDEPDFEALVLQKFRQQIRDGTASFLFARDGVEALAALKTNGGIDLVVADINMPRMDGLTLLQKLQENNEMQPARPAAFAAVSTSARRAIIRSRSGGRKRTERGG